MWAFLKTEPNMISSAGMIARLPTLPLHRMAEAWLNGVRRSADESLSAADRQEAERLIKAMHLEWARRRLSPLPDDLIDIWPANTGTVGRAVTGPEKHTPLTAHGYHVGRRFGLPTPLRREVLRRCLEEPLMPAFSAEVLQAWDEPRTHGRLLRIAEHIAESANNNRNLARNRDAVADWSNDLAFLKARYEDAHIRWPQLRRGVVIVD
jgi:hypothetical protein